MKKYIIDTNCIISYVTDRDQNQQEIITEYFETAAHFPIETCFELWPTKIMDFGDATMASLALEKNYPIITFDNTFLNLLTKNNIPVARII